MSKDLAKKGKNEVSTATAPNMTVGDFVGEDITVPKVWIMQPTSELVADGLAKAGDFINSLTSEKLGDIENPVEFVPLTLKKHFVYSYSADGPGSRHEFVRREDWTPMYERRKRDVPAPGGGNDRRELYWNFYALVKDEPLPVVFSWKSTAEPAAKQLATQMNVLNVHAGVETGFGSVMSLGGKLVKGTKGNYVVPVIGRVRDSDEKELDSARMWLKALVNQTVSMDTSDEEKTSIEARGVDENIPF